MLELTQGVYGGLLHQSWPKYATDDTQIVHLKLMKAQPGCLKATQYLIQYFHMLFF